MIEAGRQKKLPPTSELLAAMETKGYRLTLTLVGDRMECVATFEPLATVAAEHVSAHDSRTETIDAPELGTAPSSLPSDIAADELIHLLEQHGIAKTIDFDALHQCFALIEAQQLPEPTVIARGIKPVAGEDGWFELLVKASGGKKEFIADEHGRVDLKTLHAYTLIEAEQKLGIVHPPQPGTSGCTVQGVSIEAPAGQPAKIIAGEGVVLKYGGRIAFSEKAGRALFEKNVLSVVDQLVIPGNVDLNVGHIDFHGFVEIKGDVLDNFDVRSTKGIKIAGYVGACHLESRGEISIGTMAGKEIGRILCQGDLHARFLNQVAVVCYGDVIVSHEIRNSNIRATGCVIVERGGIIGGHCVALEGISASVIGADSGQKTNVAAGIYFPDNDRFLYLTQQLKKVQQQINSISGAIDPLKRHLHRESELAASALVRLKVLNEKLDQLYEQKNAFSAEIAASQPQDLDIKNPKINVLKSLKEGVTITLGRVREEIELARNGPLSIIENSRAGGLRFLQLSPLTVSATQLEQQMSEEEERAS